MLDENGQPYARRRFDGFMLLPIAGSLMIAIGGWGVSVESRINAMSVIQQERAPVIIRHSQEIGELYALARDPEPRPKAKVILDQMMSDHAHHEDRINRLEERLSNLHQFLLQVKPVVPPSRRGQLPFTPEDKG